MQRLFVLLLIVLLPLRGLAGDLMSVHMATSGAAKPAAGAMPGDCPMHAQAATHDAAPDPMPSGMGDCAACVLCTPVAEAAGLGLDLVSCAVHAKPLAAGIGFVSVAPTPSFKPPIS